MMAFTDGRSFKAWDHLRARGWLPGRVMDLSEVRAQLLLIGLPLNGPAEAILRELIGLNVPTYGGTAMISFDPLTVMRDFFDQGVVPLIRSLHPEPLCPIGYGNGTCVFVSDSGTALWLNDQLLQYTVGLDAKTAVQA